MFLLSAKHIFEFIGRIQISKENKNGNSNPIRSSFIDRTTHDVEIDGGFILVLFCCFYVLFIQVVVLGVDAAALIRASANGYIVNWWFLCLPSAQGLAWFVMSFSVLHCKVHLCEKFPFLLRICWLVSSVICLYTLYLDDRALVVEQGSRHLSSHGVTNIAATPALAFLCIVAIRGTIGIKVSRYFDLQEPLHADDDDEEEAGCLKVTPYNDAVIFSLAKTMMERRDGGRGWTMGGERERVG